MRLVDAGCPPSCPRSLGRRQRTCSSPNGDIDFVGAGRGPDGAGVLAVGVVSTTLAPTFAALAADSVGGFGSAAAGLAAGVGRAVLAGGFSTGFGLAAIAAGLGGGTGAVRSASAGG